MKAIQLTKNKISIVDDCDYNSLIDIKWYAIRDKNRYYAFNNIVGYMHRLILGLSNHKVDTDHIDRNGLNNVRSNLRIVSRSENLFNRGKLPNNKSGFKGVSWNKCKWVVQIGFNGSIYRLGRFDDVIEAALEYDEAAKIFHGRYAKLNFD
jgi:hypothetical protein